MTPEAVEELMQKVHLLEMKARRLSRESFAGVYHASFKGQGLDFEDFREYMHGDEPRFIDWNVTARMNQPFIRTFREERELNIILSIDISGSSIYGSRHQSKRELAAEIAAVLAFTARLNGDKVGLHLFAEETELFLPPQKGSKHILRLIREILHVIPKNPATNLSEASRFLNRAVTKKSLVFMLSDFIAYDFAKPMGALARKHDLVAIRLFDPSEHSIPNVGRVILTDPETGFQSEVNTSNANVRMGYKKLFRRHLEAVDKIFHQYQIDFCEASTDEDYLPPLLKMLKTRASRHA